jgi:hypothetical protein
VNPNRTERLIQWCFALLAVVVAWQLEVPQRLGGFASGLGAAKGSWLYRLIVDGGVPVALTLAAGFSIWFYETLLWRFSPWSSCKRGWWIYALVAQGPKETVDIVGYFLVDHSASRARITEGHAFYWQESRLSFRGDWESQFVTFDEGCIRVLFSMRAVTAAAEAIPSQYEGYLELRYHDTPLLGGEAWSGFFQDLGDRRLVIGPVYSEYLRRLRRLPDRQVRELLARRAHDLVLRARERLVPRAA